MSFVFQMIVKAYDSAVPSEVVSAPIEVTIRRNNVAPRFGLSSYPASIYDFYDPGTFVGAVFASDEDLQVNFCLQIFFNTLSLGLDLWFW